MTAPDDPRMTAARWLGSWPRQWWGWLSYAVRPYDMIADDRRWFWQPRTHCGWSYGYHLDDDGRVAVAHPDCRDWSDEMTSIDDNGNLRLTRRTPEGRAEYLEEKLFDLAVKRAALLARVAELEAERDSTAAHHAEIAEHWRAMSGAAEARGYDRAVANLRDARAQTQDPGEEAKPAPGVQADWRPDRCPSCGSWQPADRLEAYRPHADAEIECDHSWHDEPEPKPAPADPAGLDALKERLAAIEHERWAHWQRYMHSLCVLDDGGRFIIPAGLVERWERQIATPYAELSEHEKGSDREQVARYWPVIEPYLRRGEGHRSGTAAGLDAAIEAATKRIFGFGGKYEVIASMAVRAAAPHLARGERRAALLEAADEIVEEVRIEMRRAQFEPQYGEGLLKAVQLLRERAEQETT